MSAIPKQLLFPVLATGVVLSTGCWAKDTGPSRQTTTQAITAVAERIFPLTKDGDYEECPPLPADPDDYSQCPVTPRLLDRLKQNPSGFGAGSAAPFCRCQNTSPDRSITAEVTPGGGIAHVRLFEGRSRIDLVMRLQDGRLLVDDTRCTGRGESTSMYSRHLADCGGAE